MVPPADRPPAAESGALTPLASGQEADVFALDEGRVLRRYRSVTDVTGEAAVMTYVRAFGYPVPRVFEATGSDMVLERLDGPTLAAALIDGKVPISYGAELLADLLRRLHELQPWPGATGSSILHLDLHPQNVMLTAGGPVVIDWCNATGGPADLDTALSALIMAQVAEFRAGALTAMLDTFLDTFLGVAPGDPTRLLADAVEIRSRQLVRSPDEIEQLPAAAARVRRSGAGVKEAGR